MGVAILAGGVIADAQVARKTIVPIEERWRSLTGNAELISSRVAGGFQWSVRDAISTPDHRLWIHLISEPEPRAERLHVGVLRATPSVPSGSAVVRGSNENRPEPFSRRATLNCWRRVSKPNFILCRP